MKKILPGEKKATYPNIIINGVVSSDKHCIANAFTKFFTSAARKLMATLLSTCDHNQSDPNTSAHRYPPFLRLIRCAGKKLVEVKRAVL